MRTERRSGELNAVVGVTGPEESEKRRVADNFRTTAGGWVDDETQMLNASLTIHPPTRESPAVRGAAASGLPHIFLYEEGQPMPSIGMTSLEVTSPIAAGGMGVIHCAMQHALGREVAIKRIRPERGSPETLGALLREARLLGRLDHPNILPVHMLGSDAAHNPVLVMKRIRGAEWKAMLEEADHPGWKQLGGDRLVRNINVLIQVCNAVDYAHSRGVVHRDIKTSNVMVGDFGEIYLLDWGIAVELEANGERYEKQYAGTPVYSAPEMFDHRRPITRQTDVYLLGAVLHELLAGKPLHDRDSAVQVVVAALDSVPQEYGDMVPEELVAIVHKATAAKTADRFASVREFKEALESYLSHRSAIALVHSAETLLAELEKDVSAAVADTEPDVALVPNDMLHELGIRTRFAFEQAIHAWPEREKSHVDQSRCLGLLFQLAVAEENTSIAELLEHELKMHQMVDASAATSFGEQLESLRQRKSERSDELSTQIQYTLIERLSAAEAEIRRLSQTDEASLDDGAGEGES